MPPAPPSPAAQLAGDTTVFCVPQAGRHPASRTGSPTASPRPRARAPWTGSARPRPGPRMCARAAAACTSTCPRCATTSNWSAASSPSSPARTATTGRVTSTTFTATCAPSTTSCCSAGRRQETNFETKLPRTVIFFCCACCVMLSSAPQVCNRLGGWCLMQLRSLPPCQRLSAPPQLNKCIKKLNLC